MTAPYQTDVMHLLARVRPASLLSVGAHGRDFYADYLTGAHCEFLHLPVPEALARLGALPRFNFALVSGLESAAKTEAGTLIARLRDLHADRFVVVTHHAAANHWTTEELLAYGLYRVAEYASARLALYEFDITHYKQTPDWLNDKYWANPDLFDKYRW